MPTQQETENPPLTRLAALNASYKLPFPRRYGLAAALALIPFIAGFIGLGVYAFEDRPYWTNLTQIAGTALVVIHVTVAAVEKPWARVVSLVAMALSVLFWIITFAGMLSETEAPLWVPFSLFGGTAVALGATVGAARIRYREMRRGDVSQKFPQRSQGEAETT